MTPSATSALYFLILYKSIFLTTTFKATDTKNESLERLNTLNLQSQYLLFGGGSLYPLRVAPDVKTFLDRLRPPRTLT